MSDAISITAIRDMYPEEWVIAKVTEVDEANVPVAGIVLVHHPDEETIFESLQAYRAEHPAMRLYTFFTGSVIPEGVHLAFPFG
ncbi:hypothetical protein [Candidatus Entotheonella palauensis]|uniref:Uncharacterized protein n=1 Tax=Candidatus Entotheonella gemina TaxID=1429439 RepID=W4M7S7_9BACT|nr:hypothetical protein [Candidatus Entotheonella palauensis]ETX06255.1 MAG: hypothetical protein ETSY2_18220 [Candidatus Entotheonella gemina]